MTQTLKLSDKTLSILKNYSAINSSIYFKQGSVVSTTSPSKFVISYATVDETFEKDFAIYELSKFLSVLSIFNNPDIIIYDKYCEIIEGNKSVKYVFCDPDNIRVPPPLDKIEISEPLIEFPLTDKELKSILKGASILRSQEISIEGNGEQILIRGIDQKNSTDNTYSFIVGNTDKEFKIILKVEYIKLIEDNYNISIHKTKKGGLLLCFANEYVTYYNAVEPNSYFN